MPCFLSSSRNWVVLRAFSSCKSRKAAGLSTATGMTPLVSPVLHHKEPRKRHDIAGKRSHWLASQKQQSWQVLAIQTRAAVEVLPPKPNLLSNHEIFLPLRKLLGEFSTQLGVNICWKESCGGLCPSGLNWAGLKNSPLRPCTYVIDLPRTHCWGEKQRWKDNWFTAWGTYNAAFLRLSMNNPFTNMNAALTFSLINSQDTGGTKMLDPCSLKSLSWTPPPSRTSGLWWRHIWWHYHWLSTHIDVSSRSFFLLVLSRRQAAGVPGAGRRSFTMPSSHEIQCESTKMRPLNSVRFRWTLLWWLPCVAQWTHFGQLLEPGWMTQFLRSLCALSTERGPTWARRTRFLRIGIGPNGWNSTASKFIAASPFLVIFCSFWPPCSS